MADTAPAGAKRPRGRPRGSSPESRYREIRARVNEDELARVEAAAAREGISASEWLRRAALERAGAEKCI